MFVTGLEVTIQGLTFIVDGDIVEGEAGYHYTPPSGAYFECSSAEVKGQPEADADSILEAIKVELKHGEYGFMYTNGFELIERHITENINDYLGK